MNLNKISAKYKPAQIDCCNENQCKLKTSNKTNFIMLKGELVANHRKMCDCIIFQNDKKIAHVELKSSSLNVGKIIDKFRNSGNVSYHIAKEASPTDKFKLFFILMTKSYGNNSAFNRLKESHITIHGKKHQIRHGRCGSSLRKFISS